MSPAPRNGAVASVTVGIPIRSSATASSKLLDVQEPHFASPLTTPCT